MCTERTIVCGNGLRAPGRKQICNDKRASGHCYTGTRRVDTRCGGCDSIDTRNPIIQGGGGAGRAIYYKRCDGRYANAAGQIIRI